MCTRYFTYVILASSENAMCYWSKRRKNARQSSLANDAGDRAEPIAYTVQTVSHQNVYYIKLLSFPHKKGQEK